ncbi:hypothetical protein JXC34_01535 [Candidatus Woesearchaeota archaeon]|nr:hypothetical protein [Candidatus Woesearchaeota archaeon]
MREDTHTIDTRVSLIHDELFRRLLIQDYVRVRTQPLAVDDLTKNHLNIQTMMGHLSTEDINNIENNGYPRTNYRPYKNVSPFDVAQVLYEEKLFPSPEEIFAQGQNMIRQYKELLHYSLNERKRPDVVYMTDVAHQYTDEKPPLFGIDFLKGKSITNMDAFWKGTLLGLIMDDPYYRALSGLDLGLGLCIPINRDHMITPKKYSLDFIPDFLKKIGLKKLWPFDKCKLSNLDFRSRLDPHMPLTELVERFHSDIMPLLIKSGLVPEPGEYQQGESIVPGYIRIARGPGTSDWKAINLAYTLWGPDAALGVLLADVMDTIEKTSLYMSISKKEGIFSGSQDEGLLRELMDYKEIKRLMKRMNNLNFLTPLFELIREDPAARHPEASVSVRYFTRIYSIVRKNGKHAVLDDTTTVYEEIWRFMGDFKDQYWNGKVRPDLVDFNIGYECTGSRWYYDRYMKLVRALEQNREFPYHNKMWALAS